MELMKTDSGHPKILAGHRLRQNKKSLTNLDIDQMAFKKYGQNYGPGPEDNYGGGPTLRTTLRTVYTVRYLLVNLGLVCWS